MKQAWKSKVIATAAAFLGATALSGTNVMADQTVDVNAVLNQPITETKIADLDFGTIGMDPAGDIITLDAQTDGAAALSSAASGSDVTAADSAPGHIQITSGISFDVDITYPAVATTLTGGVSADTINLTDIGANSTADYTHDGTVGTSDIYVGGVITVPDNGTVSHTDTYTGSFTVALVYQ